MQERKNRVNFQETEGGLFEFCENCNGWFGELGQEPHPDQFIDHLVQIFIEARRVLKTTGTMFINLGDTYAGSGGAGGDWNTGDRQFEETWHQGEADVRERSLVGIPALFEIAMKKVGFIHRNTIIWKKGNPMPESVTNRYTVDYEKVFFFSMEEKYYFKQQFENVTSNDVNWRNYKPTEKRALMKNINRLDSKNPLKRTRQSGEGTDTEIGTKGRCGSPHLISIENLKKSLIELAKSQFPNDFIAQSKFCEDQLKVLTPKEFHDNETGLSPTSEIRQKRKEQFFLRRNKRCVWPINTSPYSGAHFATYPEELLESPMDAGVPSFVCNECGKAREYVTKKDQTLYSEQKDERKGKYGEGMNSYFSGNSECGGNNYYQFQLEHPPEIILTKCDCNKGFHPGIVYDPFGGSGTTGLVALKHAKNFVISELNPEYLKLAHERLDPLLKNKKMDQFFH
jgi:DNA modification methylase